MKTGSTIFKIIWVIFFFSNTINIEAQTLNFFEEENKNLAKLHLVESKYLSTKRDIIVHTPPSYHKNNYKNYPVLYMLDGKRNIKHVISTANILAAKRKMPEIIIVALPAGKTREKDYTPNYLSTKSGVKAEADRFTNFLEFELIPFVDENFRTVPFRIISGHSRSGLFVLDNLINKTELFQAHFAFSPALWVDDYKIFEKLAEKLKTIKLDRGFIYLNAGGKENSNIKTSLNKIRLQFERSVPENLKWYAENAEDETHGTTPIIGHYVAFRKLFTNWDRPWKEYSKNGLKVIKPQYDLLSEELGYLVIPEERSLNGLGYYFLQKKDVEKAIEAFELNIQYYPKSPNAYDSLADALEAKGLLEEALKTLDKALPFLNKNQSLLVRTISEHRTRLKRKLQKSKPQRK